MRKKRKQIINFIESQNVNCERANVENSSNSKSIFFSLKIKRKKLDLRLFLHVIYFESLSIKIIDAKNSATVTIF